MNPSKYSRAAGILAVVLLWFSVAFLLLYRYAPTERPIYFPPEHVNAGEIKSYIGLTRDASVTYAPIIQGEKEVTNWHSALYMYECRALLLMSNVLSLRYNSVNIQILWYYVHIIALLIAISFLWYRVCLRNPSLVFLIFPIVWSFNKLFCSVLLGLDFFFFVHLSILCIATILSLQTKRKLYRIVGWCIVAICLFHAVNYRKNAILLLPFIACLFLSTFAEFRLMRVRGKILIWGMLTLFFSLICIYSVPICLPVVHKDPISPMLASDVRIMAILRGEQEKFREDLRTLGVEEKRLMHPYCNTLTAYWGGEFRQNGCLIPKTRDIYFENWIAHPSDMLVSRIIQTVEFYCGGSMPVGKSIISELYPAIKNNPDAWHYLMRMRPKQMGMRLSILFSGIVLTIMLYLKRRKNPQNWATYDRATFISCTTAILYAGSFTLVPPTADARYLAPSLFIIWNASWAWGILTLSHFIKKKTYSPE